VISVLESTNFLRALVDDFVTSEVLLCAGDWCDLLGSDIGITKCEGCRMQGPEWWN